MTYKTKNRILIIGFILVSIIVYQMAISVTLETKKKVRLLESQAVNFEGVSKISSNLSAQERYLDSVLLKNNLKNTSVQNGLLEFLTTESELGSVKITEFKEPHKNVNDGLTTTSYQFTLQGNYKEIESLLHRLEQETGYGKLSHVSFEKQRDFRRRKDFLQASIIIESYSAQ